MKKVIIVESPSKSKTIESYLKDEYKVLSSKGHICDLATKGKFGLGVDVDNDFKPTYVIDADKKELVETLKKECKNALVYLATDPDREGEAISYHLATYLGLDVNKVSRIEFHEVTKNAILNAINNPRNIDINLVKSQETRRILDRIIGFMISKLLQSKIKSKSAGRVQSVALKMICDLEDEIKKFIPTKYYEIEAYFDDYKLVLDSIDGKKSRILDRKILEDLYENLDLFKFKEKESKEFIKESKPPFTTSTLQQEASYKLNFTSVKTMNIAQKLYEGVLVDNKLTGLITYMRTDSTVLSNEFISQANEFIKNNYGNTYVGAIKTKEQKLAQNAHEAIRPTYISNTPELIKGYLTNDEYKLYKLIYERALSSLMTGAKFLNTKCYFENYKSIWTVSGKQMLFDGYLKVLGKDEEDFNKLLPDFKENELYKANEIKILDLETKPKSRYTEATLIKDMEEKGIGRPSTYAQTMQTLLKRNYINQIEKKLYPTDQGLLTNEKLEEFFPSIFNVSYTANMEEILDLIAQGMKDEISELKEFYNKFLPLYDKAYNEMEKIAAKKTGDKCPLCGHDLVIRTGKYGDFVACSNYPACKYIKQDNTDIVLDIMCPVCHDKHLIKRENKSSSKKKYYYICENYKNCKTVFNDEPTDKLCPDCNSMMLKNENNELYCSKHCHDTYKEVMCPVCKEGHLIKKQASKGKNKGNYFYACNRFPKCRTIFNYEPTENKCEICSSMMLKDENENLFCSNKDCKNSKVE